MIILISYLLLKYTGEELNQGLNAAMAVMMLVELLTETILIVLVERTYGTF